MCEKYFVSKLIIVQLDEVLDKIVDEIVLTKEHTYMSLSI